MTRRDIARGARRRSRRSPSAPRCCSSRTFSERAGGTVAAEGREPAAHRLVQGARRGRQARRARRRRASAASCARRRATTARASPRRPRRSACRARSTCPTTRRSRRSRRCAGQGADVRIGGGSPSTTASSPARARAGEDGLAFVHPFDDPDVIAGQGSLGLELLEDVPDLARVIVPVGGGGLASGDRDRGQVGASRGARDRRPGGGVRAVQGVAGGGEPIAVESSLTIADGIAVKRPGELTLPLLAQWLDELVDGGGGRDRRGDDPLPRAREARGRGRRRGRASPRCSAARSGRPPEHGTTVAVLSGGNVDAGAARDDRAPPRDAGRAPPGRSSPASPTGRARSRDCCSTSRRRARTSSTSRTCARASTCTCARRRSSSCSRRAGATTPNACSRSWPRRATRPA